MNTHSRGRFLPIRDILQIEDDSCFIGAVSNIQAPVQPDKAGGDHIINFTIQDRFPGDDKDSVACIIKRRMIQELPKGNPGDVAILRGMKLEILGLPPKKTLVNCPDRQSEALFFPMERIPDTISAGSPKLLYSGMLGSKPPSHADQMAAINMKAAAAPLLEELRNPKAMYLARLGKGQAKSRRGKRQEPLSNWTFNLFYDLIGEVVKTFWGTADSVDLYVTDYTTNRDLFLYEETSEHDTFGDSRKPWPGPFGQMTIAIRLYEPHAGKAREIKEGDFVYIQNIRSRYSPNNKLEGAVHADPQYPDRINIRKCTHQAQLGALKERKDQYEKERTARLLANGEPENTHQKPSAVASGQKKQTKKEKKRLQKERFQKEEQEKADVVEPVAKGLNGNVCTGGKDVALSDVDEIVSNKWLHTHDGFSMPFVNSRYRTRLRVVDHYPFELEDFTRVTNVPVNSQASMSASSNEIARSFEHGATPLRYAWHFFLLVEDAGAPAGTNPTRFPLTIDTPRAQGLLKMDPVDLRIHPQKLLELENKLFILWGNLHERKVALKEQGIDLPLPVEHEALELRSMPFECCIEEYGVFVNEEDVPFTDEEVASLIKHMSDPDPEVRRRAVETLGNPASWKRTWSPYNTIIKDS